MIPFLIWCALGVVGYVGILAVLLWSERELNISLSGILLCLIAPVGGPLLIIIAISLAIALLMENWGNQPIFTIKWNNNKK